MDSEIFNKIFMELRVIWLGYKESRYRLEAILGAKPEQ